MPNPILEIRNLSATAAGKEILRGMNLTVNAGEVHAVMGPNASGKSTLTHVLAGREGYEVTGGEVRYQGKDLLAMPPEDRAREGLFLAFQYPIEIPGMKMMQFLKAALNAIRKHRGLEELDALDFLKIAKEKMQLLEMDPDLLNRPVNAGFSGGEKKRSEILQMAVLDPKLAILDETDSGLDIDALKIVASGVNSLRRQDRAMILITHYQRLLNYIVPDYVHVLIDGRIVKTGGRELALSVEEQGYGWLEEDVKREATDLGPCV
jgi:Fe-S cluster assembly ATP-binding protein